LSKDLIIFGNGGLSSVVKYYCALIGLKVAGFTVDENYLTSDTFEELPNVNFTDVTNYFPPEKFMLFIAIGASDLLGFVRQEKIISAFKMGYELFRHNFFNDDPKNKINIGENSIIMPNSHVDPYVKIGDGVIVWNGSTICHHTTIGDYSFIAPGATICGKVKVGNNCYIGSNATIRNNLCVANQTLIGAGAYINHDTDFQGVYLPAKSVKINRSSKEIKF